MRFSRGPERFHRGRAPLLGEHTEDELRASGSDDNELRELEAAGVIGREPLR